MEAKDMIEDKTIDPLQSTVWRLLVKKPFYAHVLMGMKRSYTTSIPTLGVGVSSEINLLVNKKFLESLTPKERAAVLEHEVLHLINGHLERYQKEMNKMKFNIAADIAINQYIPDLPIYNEELKKNGGFLPQHFDLPDNQTTEFYYNKLRDEDMQKVKNRICL